MSQEEKPALKWGADADGGAPYVLQHPTRANEIIGFEKDLADALAKELGQPIHFTQYVFDSLIPGVERGDVDFAMNGLEVTADRKERVLISKPYYLYQQQLVVRAGEKRFRTLEECIGTGYVIGTLGASTADRLLGEMGINKRIYEEQKGPYVDLARGQIDGVLLDLPVALYYAAPDSQLQHSQRVKGLEFAGAPFAEGQYAIFVSKENPALLTDLNAALDRLREKGELKRILQKWELWNTEQYRLYAHDSMPELAVHRMSFWEYLPLLLRGAGITVLITVLSMLLAVAIGLPVAISRLYGPWPLRWLAALYVEFFRGIPVLLVLYFLYYGLASISPAFELGPLQAAIIGFGLNYAAYEAEIYRAGISSIPRGQWEAAASLGMSPVLTFHRIILPQSVRIILPPMTNDFVALFKDTSVVSIIAVVELSKQYQILTKSVGGYVQIGMVTAGLYLIMSVPLSHLAQYLEKRWTNSSA